MDVDPSRAARAEPRAEGDRARSDVAPRDRLDVIAARPKAGRGASSASPTPIGSGRRSRRSRASTSRDPVDAWWRHIATLHERGASARRAPVHGPPFPGPRHRPPRRAARGRALAQCDVPHLVGPGARRSTSRRRRSSRHPTGGSPRGRCGCTGAAVLVRLAWSRAAGSGSREARSWRRAPSAARSSFARSSRRTRARRRLGRGRARGRRLGGRAARPPASAIGLLDENASSHVAIGSGYTEPVTGSASMDDDERSRPGSTSRRSTSTSWSEVPTSTWTALGSDGSAVPILRQGHWVLGP